MTPHDPDRTFETELHLAAPRDAVWEAIATDAGLASWFAPTAHVEPRVGGEVVWDWGGHHRWAQRIEILEPGVRLKTRYDSPVDDGAGGKKPLFIDFLLEGDGGTTTLRLVQSGFGPEAAFDEEYDGISRGWPVELESLRLYLEKHRGETRRVVWCTADLDMESDAAWERLAGEEGFAVGADLATLAKGDPLRVEGADGDVYEGRVLDAVPRALAAELDGFGGAFFRLCVERWGGLAHAWLWLGAYGAEESELERLRDLWTARLERLFPQGTTQGVRIGGGV